MFSSSRNSMYQNSNNVSLVKGVIAGGLFLQVKAVDVNRGSSMFPYLVHSVEKCDYDGHELVG